MFTEVQTSHSYRYLESGPIVMVSTRGRDGRNNLMTMGFHMMIQHDPALVGAVIGPWDHSHKALSETGQCVLAIPTVDLAKAVVDIGNCSGVDVDKFDRFGLNPVAGKAVDAPLVAECLVNLECSVADTSLKDAYNLWVLRVERVWVDEERTEKRLIHHAGDGQFIVDGRTLDLGSRMVRWKHLAD